MSAAIVAILDAARRTGGAPAIDTPVLVSANGTGSEKFGAGRQAILQVSRNYDSATATIEGTVAVWGADLAHPTTGALAKVQRFKGGDGGSGGTTFDPTLADMPYAAAANNNWIVLLNGVPVPPIAGATGFAVSNPSTTQARITLGTAAAANDVVDIYKVTPVAVLADGENTNVRQQVRAYTAMWVTVTYATNKMSRTLATLTPAA